MTTQRKPTHADPSPGDAGDEPELSAPQILATLARPTDWRTIPAQLAPALWAELRAWVTWLAARYGLDHHHIPPCWYLHPALVDLLTALRDQHRAAHHHLAQPAAPAAWQATLWQFEPRLRDWVARAGCTRDQHRDDLPITWPDDTTRWQAHVAHDQAARTQQRHLG